MRRRIASKIAAGNARKSLLHSSAKCNFASSAPKFSLDDWLWNAAAHAHLKRAIAERGVRRVISWNARLDDLKRDSKGYSFTRNKNVQVESFGSPMTSTSLLQCAEFIGELEDESFVFVADDDKRLHFMFREFLTQTEDSETEESSLIFRTTPAIAENILIRAEESGIWFGDYVAAGDLFGDLRSDWHRARFSTKPEIDPGLTDGSGLRVIELFGSQQLLRDHDTEREFE